MASHAWTPTGSSTGGPKRRARRCWSARSRPPPWLPGSRLRSQRWPICCMCTGIECWRVGPVESPNVAGLVYIAAFGLAECETLGALSRKPHPPQRWRISSPTHMDTAGSEGDFVRHFAADVDSTLARVMYAVQQPLAASAFGQVMGVPAWKSLPSWYLVAELDEAIPP